MSYYVMKKKRFTDRILIERRTLALVNSLFQERLAGLSKRAINNWSRRTRLPIDNEIPTVILQIAHSADLLVECSRDTFAEEDSIELRHCFTLIDRLEDTLMRKKCQSS